MNRTTYMMTEGQNYYENNKKRIWIVGIMLLIILLFISIGFITKTVTAKSQSDGERVKLVTSVEVQKGDSLWSIASDYYKKGYSDINDYIKEIKATNGLSDDDIHAGNFIVVPYYEKVY